MRYTYSFFLIIILASCTTSKQAITKTPNAQIRFGSGGGFTGATTEYCVLSNGNLFRHKNLEMTTLSAKKKDVSNCFDKCEAIHFTDKKIDEPGNTYSYIEYRTGDQIHRVTWNPKQSKLPADLIEFYNLLLILVGEPPLKQSEMVEEGMMKMSISKKREGLSKIQPSPKKTLKDKIIDFEKGKKQKPLPKYKQ